MHSGWLQLYGAVHHASHAVGLGAVAPGGSGGDGAQSGQPPQSAALASTQLKDVHHASQCLEGNLVATSSSLAVAGLTHLSQSAQAGCAQVYGGEHQSRQDDIYIS